MRTSLIFACLLVAQAFVPSVVFAQDAEWEVHYTRAEKAYASFNLFEARKEFMVALKGAKDCKQDQELATRVESLASSYQAKDNKSLAQPLFKLARKLKSKSTTT